MPTFLDYLHSSWDPSFQWPQTAPVGISDQQLQNFSANIQRGPSMQEQPYPNRWRQLKEFFSNIERGPRSSEPGFSSTNPDVSAPLWDPSVPPTGPGPTPGQMYIAEMDASPQKKPAVLAQNAPATSLPAAALPRPIPRPTPMPSARAQTPVVAADAVPPAPSIPAAYKTGSDIDYLSQMAPSSGAPTSLIPAASPAADQEPPDVVPGAEPGTATAKLLELVGERPEGQTADDKRQQLGMSLLLAGLQTMSAASKPGATTLGSVGEGGSVGVANYMQASRDARKENADKSREYVGALSALGSLENAAATRDQTATYQRGVLQNQRDELKQRNALEAQKMDIENRKLGAQGPLQASQIRENNARANYYENGGSGDDGGKTPNQLALVDGLVSRGIAKDSTDAWKLIKESASNPTETIAKIYDGLQKDPMNLGRPPADLATEAKRIFSDLSSGVAPLGQMAMPQGARQAPDGKWYVQDPNRPGKYLQITTPGR